jgi:hypothetical protein
MFEAGRFESIADDVAHRVSRLRRVVVSLNDQAHSGKNRCHRLSLFGFDWLWAAGLQSRAGAVPWGAGARSGRGGWSGRWTR